MKMRFLLSLIVSILSLAIIVVCCIWLFKPNTRNITEGELDLYIRDLIESADPGDEGTGRWSRSLPVDNERGDCNIYFTLTRNPQIVDSLEPVPLDAFPNPCSNGFNMALRKVERECLADSCLTMSGARVQRGTIDEYYESCDSLPACSNIAQVVTANYFRENAFISPDTRCLVAGQNNQALSTSCRLVGNQDAVFQVDRLSSNLQIPVFNESFNLNPVWKDFGENQLNTWVNSYENKVPRNMPVELVRIMKPAQFSCLGNVDGTLSFAPCSDLEDNGFVWVNNLTTLDYSSSVTFGGQLMLLEDIVNSKNQFITEWLFENMNAYSISNTSGINNFLEAVPFRCYNTVTGRWTSPPCETLPTRSVTYARHLTSQANNALRMVPGWKYPSDPTILRWTINHFQNRTSPRTYSDIRDEAISTYSLWKKNNPEQGRIRGLDISGSRALLTPIAPCSSVAPGFGNNAIPYCTSNVFISPEDFNDDLP